MTALNQASIPRSTLLAKLHDNGDLEEVVQEHEHDIKVAFPTNGSAVIASTGCVRLDSPHSSPRRDQPQPTTIISRAADTTPVVTSAGALPAVKTTPITRPVTEITASAVYGQPPPPARTSLTHGSVTKPVATGTPNDTRKSVRMSAPHVQIETEPESLRSTFGAVTNSPEVPASAESKQKLEIFLGK